MLDFFGGGVGVGGGGVRGRREQRQSFEGKLKQRT